MNAGRGRLWFALSGLLVLLFIVGEISLLIWLTGQIGWWTAAVLLGSAALGALLMQQQWRKAWAAIAESVQAGQLPSGRFADATLILAGGVLLILPGLLSDVVGLLLLLPFTRSLVRSAITWLATRALPNTSPNSMVIDGEVVVEPEPSTETLIPEISAEVLDDDEANEPTIVRGEIIEP